MMLLFSGKNNAGMATKLCLRGLIILKIRINTNEKIDAPIIFIIVLPENPGPYTLQKSKRR